MALAVVLCCVMTMAVLSACTSDNDDNPVSGIDGRIIGKWCADMTGKTFAKWNYGETWQSTEFKAAFIHYRDINWSQQHLDHYTLSVCLVHQLYYTYDYKDILPNPLCRFDEGYEYCDFHRMTGWGDWLRMNQQRLVSNPQSGGGGPME